MTAPSEQLDKSVHVLLQRAAALHKGAMVFTWTAMLGQGAVFATMFWLWRDWKLGWNVHPDWWEPVVAGAVGVAIGLGLSIPFVLWFRLQADLAQVTVSMEEHARAQVHRAEETARSIRELADAGMSGEWGISTVTERTAALARTVDDTLGPTSDDEDS